MALRIVTADDVNRLLTYDKLIDALADAFRADITVPEKIAHFVKLPSGSEAKVLLMPAWTNAGERFIGHKLVNVFPDNAKAGKPSVLGSYVLMSGDTGEPLALIDGTAAAIVVGSGTPDNPQGVPVFAWKGESLEEYWDCTEQILTWADGDAPNMILDDGGDATMLVLKGRQWEEAGQVPPTTEEDSEEFGVFKALVRRTMAENPTKWTEISKRIKGVTEETTTGVLRLYQFAAAGAVVYRKAKEAGLGHDLPTDWFTQDVHP